MEFEKRNYTYKIIMVAVITALVTFLITSAFVSRYYEKTKEGMQKTLYLNTTSDLAIKTQYIKQYLEKVYIGEIPEEDVLTESAIKGYVKGLGDEFTEYLTKSEYQELMTTVTGDCVGIVVYMTKDRYDNIIILLPIEGSPAEEAGLKTGDIITKVDGEDCTGQELEIVANKVKGEEGTKVTLEILRDNKTFDVTIERRVVQVTPIKSEILEGNIGYIQIRTFDEGCCEEFSKKYEELLSKNIKSLIVDVRDNGGGLVEEAQNISDLFLDKDRIIMKQYGKDGEAEEIKAQNDAKVDKNIKVVVLENYNTASAAEILVSALKENEAAIVIGVKSYGKGIMQEIVPLSTGGALKVTIQEFRTPNDNVINKKGIDPNIEIKDDLTTEKDEQLQKAIEECKK